MGLVQKNKQPKTLVLRFLDRNLNDNLIQPIVLMKYFLKHINQAKKAKESICRHETIENNYVHFF